MIEFEVFFLSFIHVLIEFKFFFLICEKNGSLYIVADITIIVEAETSERMI